MADDRMWNKETTKTRACEILDLDQFLADRREALAEWVKKVREMVLEEIETGKITAANWPEMESELAETVAHMNREPFLPNALTLESLIFADQLASRQKTRIPNWNTFYAERVELERRINEREEGQ
jgi:hypothetical protein